MGSMFDEDYYFVPPLSKYSYTFPDPNQASSEGLLAYGGDLSSNRIISAYSNGIFPWFNDNDPILWWSPDPRAVLFPDKIKISRSLKKTLRKGQFRITADLAFRQVMLACAGPRKGETGTWITDEMVEAYCGLHADGHAHSVEIWLNDELAGGLYGVGIGRVFFGESMFTRVTDASKAAMVGLCRQLQTWDFELIDCQVASPHLFTLGAQEIPRNQFRKLLTKGINQQGKTGMWKFDEGVLCL